MGDAPRQAAVPFLQHRANFVLTGGDDAFKSFRRRLTTLSYTPRKQRCALFKFAKVLWRKQVLARNSRFKFVKNDASVVCVLWLQAFWYTLIPCKYKVQLIIGANMQFMTPSIIKWDTGLISPLRSAGVSSDCGRRWSNSWWFPGPGTGLGAQVRQHQQAEDLPQGPVLGPGRGVHVGGEDVIVSNVQHKIHGLICGQWNRKTEKLMWRHKNEAISLHFPESLRNVLPITNTSVLVI